MSNNSPAKKKRKAISLETKIQILDRLATGEKALSVGRLFDLHESTVRTIRGNEVAIRKSVCSGTKLSAKSASYTRDYAKEKMEKVLVKWMEEMSQNRMPVDGNSIKQAALRIYKQIKETEPGTSSESKKATKFSASTGWMTGFLERHALHNIKINETAFSDETATISQLIKDGGCNPDQVWNIDESGIAGKRMSNRTYVAKSQKTSAYSKVAKDRVTLVFCSNASRDHILKSLLDRTRKSLPMKSADTNEDPVLNANLVKEGLDLSDKLGNHFAKCDPNQERTLQFQRDLKSLMSSYNELYTLLATMRNKPPITEFSNKTTTTSEPQDITERSSLPMDEEESISSDISDILILNKRIRLLSESDSESCYV